MIVVVTGSRRLLKHPQRVEIKTEFLRTLRALKPTALFHGGADGPDAWAALEFPDIARMFRPGKTDNYNDAVDALFARNHTMILAADQQAYIQAEGVVLVACWDGKSRGTKDAIDFADSMGMPVVSVPVNLIEARRPA